MLGLDLYACEAAHIGPGERWSVGTGVAVEIPDGHAGLVLPRSGLAQEHGIALVNSPGLIDSGYRGELRVLLLNTDPAETFRVEAGRPDRPAGDRPDRPGRARRGGALASRRAATAASAPAAANGGARGRRRRPGCGRGCRSRRRRRPGGVSRRPRPGSAAASGTIGADRDRVGSESALRPRSRRRRRRPCGTLRRRGRLLQGDAGCGSRAPWCRASRGRERRGR